MLSGCPVIENGRTCGRTPVIFDFQRQALVCGVHAPRCERCDSAGMNWIESAPGQGRYHCLNCEMKAFAAARMAEKQTCPLASDPFTTHT
jgi:hypothetical protein